MLEKSVFDNKTIKSTVEEIYGIKVTHIRKIKVGSANLYSLNNDEYVLKEFQSKIKEEDIIKEIRVINHLRKDNIPVPEYIKTKDKKYLFVYKGRVVIMQKYIKGETLKLNAGTNEQIQESAKYLGKIVLSLKTLRYKLPDRNISGWYDIDSSVLKKEKLSYKVKGKYKDKVINDLNEKMYFLNYIKDKINIEEMIKKITYMKTHGDYNVLQFIYKDEKISSIIDFATSCKMPIIWEVIRSYSYIDPKCKNGNIDIDNLILYVKEFTKYIKLNKYDLKYMPYFYLIQLLCSDYGYKQYIEDDTKLNLLKFGMYRTKICKKLLDKVHLISERLQNEIEC